MNRHKKEDRISQLPDAIIHHILSLMPLKPAIRTSILSRRWKDMWKFFLALATTLDFGDELFYSCESRDEFVDVVNRYLRLHTGLRIDTFRLSFHPGNPFLSQFKKWVEFAAERGVREIDFDFQIYFPPFRLPPFLSICDTLTILKLAYCNINRTALTGCFNSLKIVFLRKVDIWGETLERLLVACPVLKDLTLWDCNPSPVKISSPSLKLKRLLLFDCPAIEMEVSAPNLTSFHLNGVFSEYSLENLSLVEDAIVIAVCVRLFVSNDRHRSSILSKLSHVRVLTICKLAVQDIFRVASEGALGGDLPIVFPNLIELHVIMATYTNKDLNALYCMFTHCIFPSLEKFFIQFQYIHDDGLLENLKGVPSERVFRHLKIIKMNGFCGSKNQVKLVKFFLEKAVVLESLVLVTPKRATKANVNKDSTSQTETNKAAFRFFYKQLMLLPKASSEARLVLCEHSEYNNSLCSTHAKQLKFMIGYNL